MAEYRPDEAEFGCPRCGRCDCVCDERRQSVQHNLGAGDGPVALPAASQVRAEYLEAIEQKAQAVTAVVLAQSTLATLEESLQAAEATVALSVEGKNEAERKARLVLALQEDQECQTLSARKRLLVERQRVAEAELSLARERCRLGYATLLCLAGQPAAEVGR